MINPGQHPNTPTRPRFIAVQVEPFKHETIDRDTDIVLATSTYGDAANALAALLNGPQGETQAWRLAVLGRLDGVGTRGEGA